MKYKDFHSHVNINGLRELEKMNYFVERSESFEAGVQRHKADLQEKNENDEYLRRKLEE